MKLIYSLLVGTGIAGVVITIGYFWAKSEGFLGIFIFPLALIIAAIIWISSIIAGILLETKKMTLK